jgi:hypothetical protein
MFKTIKGDTMELVKIPIIDFIQGKTVNEIQTALGRLWNIVVDGDLYQVELNDIETPPVPPYTPLVSHTDLTIDGDILTAGDLTFNLSIKNIVTHEEREPKEEPEE